MKISKAEQTAIQQVVKAGRQYGYGNMISHLYAAWAKHLRESGMAEVAATYYADGGYPIQMHLDLMDRGEWDETGERYRGSADEAEGEG